MARTGRRANKCDVKGSEDRHSGLGAAFTARTTVRPRFEACDKQQVDNFNHVVHGDTNCPTHWCYGQAFRMLDGNRPSVSQIDFERSERNGVTELSDLIDSHKSYTNKFA